MHEYIQIYDHREGSGYISYNTQSEITLQVNEKISGYSKQAPSEAPWKNDCTS